MKYSTLIATGLAVILVVSCKKVAEKGSPENDGSIDPEITIGNNLENSTDELDPINPERGNPEEFKGRINFRVLNIKGDEEAYFKDCLSLKVKETSAEAGQGGTFRVPFGCNKRGQQLQSLKDDDTFEKDANGNYVVKDVLYLEKEAKPYPYLVHEGTQVELNIALMITRIKVAHQESEGQCTPQVAKLNQGTYCNLETIYGNPKEDSGLPDIIRRLPDGDTNALPQGAKCFKQNEGSEKTYRIYFDDQPDNFIRQDKAIRENLFYRVAGNSVTAVYDHPDEIQQALTNKRRYTITNATEVFADSDIKSELLLRLKELVNRTKCVDNNDLACGSIGNPVDLTGEVTVSERALQDLIGIDYTDLQLEIKAEKASLLVGNQDLDGSLCKSL